MNVWYGVVWCDVVRCCVVLYCIIIINITSSCTCTIRTEEVKRNDSSVAAVVLDLVWRVEVFDPRMHLTVSPNGRHQLTAYRVVRMFRCYMPNIPKFILIKQERPLLDGKARQKHLPVAIYTVKWPINYK